MSDTTLTTTGAAAQAEGEAERAKTAAKADDLGEEPKLDSGKYKTVEEWQTAYTEYAKKAADRIPQMIDKLAEALPVERIVGTSLGTTAAHIQGTVVMGDDPATSVVDRYLIHHEYRNLLVLGASAYPTASPAYPTLTVSALSLWAADHVIGRGSA